MFMPLWNELSEQFINVIQRAIRAHFQVEQVRWIRGFAYTIFSKAMVGHISFAINIAVSLIEVRHAKTSITCLLRGQKFVSLSGTHSSHG